MKRGFCKFSRFSQNLRLLLGRGGRALAQNTHPCECPQGRSARQILVREGHFHEVGENDFPELWAKTFALTIFFGVETRPDIVLDVSLLAGVFSDNFGFKNKGIGALFLVGQVPEFLRPPDLAFPGRKIGGSRPK